MGAPGGVGRVPEGDHQLAGRCVRAPGVGPVPVDQTGRGRPDGPVGAGGRHPGTGGIGLAVRRGVRGGRGGRGGGGGSRGGGGGRSGEGQHQGGGGDRQGGGTPPGGLRHDATLGGRRPSPRRSAGGRRIRREVEPVRQRVRLWAGSGLHLRELWTRVSALPRALGPETVGPGTVAGRSRFDHDVSHWSAIGRDCGD